MMFEGEMSRCRISASYRRSCKPVTKSTRHPEARIYAYQRRTFGDLSDHPDKVPRDLCEPHHKRRVRSRADDADGGVVGVRLERTGDLGRRALARRVDGDLEIGERTGVGGAKAGGRGESVGGADAVVRWLGRVRARKLVRSVLVLICMRDFNHVNGCASTCVLSIQYDIPVATDLPYPDWTKHELDETNEGAHHAQPVNSPILWTYFNPYSRIVILHTASS